MGTVCDANGRCYTTLTKIKIYGEDTAPGTTLATQNQTSLVPTSQAPNSLFNQDYYVRQNDPTYNLLSKMYENQLAEQNSFTNKYLKPLNLGISTLSTLGGLYLGFKQYGLMKKQLGIAEEQWKRTKRELDRIQNVRKKLTDSYMNG